MDEPRAMGMVAIYMLHWSHSLVERTVPRMTRRACTSFSGRQPTGSLAKNATPTLQAGVSIFNYVCVEDTNTNVLDKYVMSIT